MAWLSRVNFTASDVLSYTDVNNLGNDIRAWGGNVNGGAYTLSNVVLSASSGTMATLTGGTAASSTLTIQSTSGTGTSDAIIFKTASQSEAMRITTGGNVGIGTLTNAGNTLRYLDLQNTDTGASAGAIMRFITSNSAGTGNTSADIVKYKNGLLNIANYDASGAIAFYNASSEAMRILSTGNVGIGTATPVTSAAVDISSTTGALVVPRMTTTQRNALTATNGMILYNTTDNQMQARVNGAWVAL